MGCSSSSPEDIEDKNAPQLNGDGKSFFIPKIGYVVKSRKPESYAVGKVFVNIFHHDPIPHVLCNEVKFGQDKSGENCLIFDTVISSSIYKNILLMSKQDSDNAKQYVSTLSLSMIQY